MKSKWVLERATIDQAQAICDLVNLAYRGDTGWTRETHLVAGDRSSLAVIEGYLADPNAHLFVAKQRGDIKACVCVEKRDDGAYIGFFAVHPTQQGLGVGKEILAQAESFAVHDLNMNKLRMVVVSKRDELISYYERRGYARTGKTLEYPVHLNVGVPLETGLVLEYLEKNA